MRLRPYTIVATSVAVALAATVLLPAQNLPTHVPPKRSSQIQNGFGINSDLPRPPYLPWNRWWWTRMFDAGVSWIRIGQYENIWRMAYVRGPEGIIVSLAERIGDEAPTPRTPS